MCTAISLNRLFGRTLDLEYHYDEKVVLTPREFDFGFGETTLSNAILGTATVADGYPLYYDAINEKGLCMAGLNFPKSARYFAQNPAKCNVASYEFIPFILRQCGSVWEAERLLADINICDRPFSKAFGTSPMHWMIADRKRSICVESCSRGLMIYENTASVLTNEPPFPLQLENLKNFSHLKALEPEGDMPSRGMGAIGLPGDFSSSSRFVRANFLAKNSTTNDDEIGQFFHILSSLEVPRGAVRLKNGKEVITQYCSCMDMQRKIYFYKTYGNFRICCVDMRREILSGNELICYPMLKKQDIFLQN